MNKIDNCPPISSKLHFFLLYFYSLYNCSSVRYLPRLHTISYQFAFDLLLLSDAKKHLFSHEDASKADLMNDELTCCRIEWWGLDFVSFQQYKLRALQSTKSQMRSHPPPHTHPTTTTKPTKKNIYKKARKWAESQLGLSFVLFASTILYVTEMCESGKGNVSEMTPPLAWE